MTFKEPLFFLLLLFVPLFVYRFFYKRNLDSSVRFSSFTILEKIGNHNGQMKAGFVYAIFIAAWITAVFAMAGPRKGHKFEKRLSEGVDIMIALDISGSMRSIDNANMRNFRYKGGYYYNSTLSLTNRLQYAKRFTADFINKRKNDRLGLVIFAGYSYTKCPLTFDHRLLLKMLNMVDFRDVNDPATAIGLAIANGVRRLIKAKAKSKVLILITDGANNRGSIDPLTAAEIAKTLGVKVYTIGFGSNNPIVPLSNSKGYYSRNRSYIDEGTLKKIAKKTGGRYFRAAGAEKLSDIYEKIDAMEKTIIEKKVFIEYEELYQVFLKWTLFLLFTAFFFKYLVFKMRP